MSKAAACVLVLLLGCVLMTGCATPSSFGGYLENRRQDLIDVVHVDFSMVDAGAVVYAGPFMVGLESSSGFKTRTPSTSLQIGLGGPRIVERSGIAGGLLLPASRWDEDGQIIGKRPNRTPSGFSVGGTLGVFLGVGAAVDALELIDFAVGLFCLDIMQDDEHVVEESAATTTKQPEDMGDAASKTPGRITVRTRKDGTVVITGPIKKIEITPGESPRQGVDKITINVGKDGTLAMDGKPITLEKLSERLAEAGRADPRPAVRIVTAPATRNEDVIKVADACRKAGLNAVSLVTAPKQISNQ